MLNLQCRYDCIQHTMIKTTAYNPFITIIIIIIYTTQNDQLLVVIIHSSNKEVNH